MKSARQPRATRDTAQLDIEFEAEAGDVDSRTTCDQDGTPLELLDAVDWDFPERSGQTDLEGIHPYPARFIPEIPGALLNALPLAPGTAVLDPFCGSGTTLVECQRRGVRAIGIDLNPIACLMSRVKTGPYPMNLRSCASSAIERARALPAATVPTIPRLDHWFRPVVQEQLARLLEAVDAIEGPAGDCLRLAVSSIIVRVSNQESDTRYAAIRKRLAPDAVGSLFLRAVERIEAALRARQYALTPARVMEHDTLAVAAGQIREPVGLVITSPPYPNAYEYWLYHKYRMWWLGFDALRVKAREIGARAHFFKKNHHTPDDFARQMRQTFALLGRVMVPGGHACFVVGRSRIHSKIIDNAGIIREAGAAHRFRTIFAAERALAAHRKSFNLSHANIKTETILVLRKESS